MNGVTMTSHVIGPSEWSGMHRHSKVNEIVGMERTQWTPPLSTQLLHLVFMLGSSHGLCLGCRTNTIGNNTIGTNTIGTNTIGINIVGTNTIGIEYHWDYHWVIAQIHITSINPKQVSQLVEGQPIQNTVCTPGGVGGEEARAAATSGARLGRFAAGQTAFPSSCSPSGNCIILIALLKPLALLGTCSKSVHSWYGQGGVDPN